MPGAGSCPPTTARPHRGRGPWCSPTARRSTPAHTCAGRQCSALCVPMSIGGSSMGVFHVTAEDGSPPSDAVQKNVEVVARRASERLAMLRAFEVSQTQANSDSLTGLMTRRSLEAAVRELRATGTPYSVAYGDLDHFKNLNDSSGTPPATAHCGPSRRCSGTRSGPPTSRAATGARSSSIVLPECPRRRGAPGPGTGP